MPMLDVAVALTNPYTLDSVNVYRRKQQINNFGEGKTQVTLLTGVPGVVYPASKNDLDRREDAQRNAKSIVILSRFAMRGESETIDGVSYQPDIVVWRGGHFLIVTVEDYSNWARGFVKMTANAIDIQDLPTMPKDLTKLSPAASGQAGYNVEPYNGGGEFNA
jgi:hypothetical protein